MENTLTFQNSPSVVIASNTFVNVPVILRYEDINLIEVVQEQSLEYTTQIPIYHQDGTYLAKVTGNRMYPTEDGKKAGLKIEKYHGLWVCKMENRTLFEIEQGTGDFFKASAELYTPDGYFVKCTDAGTPSLIDIHGNALKLGGLVLSGNTFNGCSVGVWLKKDGALAIGVNE